ncbi:DNA-processing protein DprA [Fructilactobacillus carniphilus]|uniref:DNA-processing protein DprA n=1 Tax=Fructilactobacillus carniphilus TaxID=2940297 RepID=A0ABY5C0E3_9LACO|nr:DNA-processing protein DprA [Fructilactobacillus carniphilus]USS91068.1 DNA-processing protein DprA [Fructilactobacillus carniphilus]
MDKREFLLRVKLCPGVGLKGESLIYEWLLQEQHFSRYSLAGLLQPLAALLRKHRLKTSPFIHHFLTPELTERVRANQQGGWLTILDAEYPEQLKEIFLPPIVLFYAGNWQCLTNTPVLGIVGSRNCSAYAVKSLKRTVTSEVVSRYLIVSGLAAGVDTLGHQLALAYHGKTVAVLGTGLDHYYPATNRNLQRDLAQHQLVITEYPKGAGPRRYQFVERNRIIAGLCQKLLVVEARKKSGSLITASLALQSNRDVLAIPGNINSQLSLGANELIAAGAQPCIDTQDLLGRIML